MSDLKVVFPSPCSEPWDNMAPVGCNRHCPSCDKIILDLSATTIDEAEELLEAGDEVCVRARIGKGGEVRLAEGAFGKRKMIAAFGASMALATAACHTIPPVDRPNRFEISGTVPFTYFSRKPVLRSSDGISWPLKVDFRSGTFHASNLYPGVYSLTYFSGCGGDADMLAQDIVIRDQSVDLGKLDDGGQDCIIVGVIVPADRPERG